MVVGFLFIGHGADDLTTGRQPFQVSYSGGANHTLALANASESNQLAHGDQSMSLADIRTIREKEKLRFPRDVTEVCITLYRFAVLCQVLFQRTGGAHPFVEAMWTLARSVQNMSPFITERYNGVARMPNVGPTYYARIIRAVQLNVHDYMQEVAINVVEVLVGVTIPDFTNMLQDLKRGTFHLSTNWVPIPEEYLDAPTPGSFHNSRYGSTQGNASAAGTVSTATTGLSSIMHESPARESVARVDNPQGDSAFTSLTLRADGTRAILREHRQSAHQRCRQ